MESEKQKHDEILELLKENAVIAKDTNQLLHKIYRNDMIGIGIRLVWYVMLIGLPFAMYFYFLEPYFEAFGSNYDLFREGLGEIPGLKGLEHILPGS
jgi:hypothetical protein